MSRADYCVNSHWTSIKCFTFLLPAAHFHFHTHTLFPLLPLFPVLRGSKFASHKLRREKYINKDVNKSNNCQGFCGNNSDLSGEEFM